MTGRAPFAAGIAGLALAFLAFAGTNNAAAQEIIHRFDSVVRVAKDGTLRVVETISVRAEGREIRRGIYRDFPLTFRDAEGREREVTFRLLGVERDGRPEPHFTRRQGGAIRIYAGQEDVLLRPGDYTYTFRYKTGRQIRWFDGGAELNWNVTGNAWSFPIQRATAWIELADGARPGRWTAYTGPFGARGTDWRGNINSEGALAVETTRRLAPAEGLTVVATLPEGAVEPPGFATRLWHAFLDNRNWILGGFGFALVLGYYAVAWNAVGRDPKRGTVIPLFYPPERVSPALANYIRNWGFSDAWRAFTAAALSLAVRGLLLFDDKDGELALKSTGKAPDGGLAALPPGERAILQWVESRNGRISINQSNGKEVAQVGKDFQQSIEQESRDRFFRRNLEYFLVGLILTALVIAGVLFFGGLRAADYVLLFGMAFVGVFVGVFAVPLLASVFGATGAGGQFRSAIKLIASLAFLVFVGSNVFASLPEGVGGIVSLIPETLLEYPFPFALVIGFSALNGLFLFLLRAPTDIGRRVMDQLEGFQLYLSTAEAARLNMEAPEITAERFETLLPYAVALDVEEPWSEAFAAALKRAHPGEDDPTSHYHPNWRTGGAWSGSDFGRSISSSVASAAGAFASSMPVASSGSSGFSSGGGGSGGGGGGGGGGGW